MAQERRRGRGAGSSRPPGAKQAEHENARRDGARSSGENQGEGNREADRRYRQGVADFERSGRVPKAADEARRAVDAEERRSGRARRDDDGGARRDDDAAERDRADEPEPRRDAFDRSRPS